MQAIFLQRLDTVDHIATHPDLLCIAPIIVAMAESLAGG
jgi:hypothetical protein